MRLHHRREGGDLCAIFVHAGAGYHSFANEKYHLRAVEDATQIAMTILKNGGDATDAVEMAIRLLEDREITNSGYGSNLTMDGVVECDATLVDYLGRSGAVGAVPQIQNPIGLARLILNESTKPLSLQRVPPNLLVGDGARDFAYDNGIAVMPPDFLISGPAKERWQRWKQDLEAVENSDQRQKATKDVQDSSWLAQPATMPEGRSISPPKTPCNPPLGPRPLSDVPIPHRPLQASTSDLPTLKTIGSSKLRKESADSSSGYYQKDSPTDGRALGASRHSHSDHAIDDKTRGSAKRQRMDGSVDDGDREDHITDTVGAIAVDCFGRIAAGSSSGGIGMKHKGRCGPAALVGIGTAIVPVDPDDPTQTCVAAVTSGTGEHMATTMAAATAADRIYSAVRKKHKGPGLESCDENEAMHAIVRDEFMDHPGVKESHCAGALGVMTVKKTKDGIFLYFGHNTDSFALASLHSEERKTNCVMSRSKGNGAIAQGGRAMHWRGRGRK